MKLLDPLPPLYVNVGRSGDCANAFKADVCGHVRYFIVLVAEVEGHAPPVRRQDSDRQVQLSFENVDDYPTYLPPK